MSTTSMNGGMSIASQNNNANTNNTRVVIYITNGVSGGHDRRRDLLIRFREFVDMDKTPGLELVFPRWRDVPFPTQMTCAVSDCLKEDRTEKLLKQGVLVVKSTWMLACIMERRLLVPIDESKYRLFFDDSSTTGTALTRVKPVRPLVIHVKSADPNAWSKPQDDLVEAIHRARIAGDHDKARLYEGFLLDRGRTRDHIRDREKMLFGWSASIFE